MLFYSSFGVTLEDVGISQTSVIARAGMATLVLAMPVLVASFVLYAISASTIVWFSRFQPTGEVRRKRMLRAAEVLAAVFMVVTGLAFAVSLVARWEDATGPAAIAWWLAMACTFALTLQNDPERQNDSLVSGYKRNPRELAAATVGVILAMVGSSLFAAFLLRVSEPPTALAAGLVRGLLTIGITSFMWGPPAAGLLYRSERIRKAVNAELVRPFEKPAEFVYRLLVVAFLMLVAVAGLTAANDIEAVRAGRGVRPSLTNQMVHRGVHCVALRATGAEAAIRAAEPSAGVAALGENALLLGASDGYAVLYYPGDEGSIVRVPVGSTVLTRTDSCELGGNG